MKIWRYYLYTFLLILSNSCEGKKSAPSRNTSMDRKAFVGLVQQQDSVLDLAEVLKEVPQELLEEIELTDRALKKNLRYQAVSLEVLFGMWQAEAKLDIPNTSLIFTCKDGYSPSMPLANMYGKGGFITLGIKNADNSYSWPDSIAEKFAPLYLVWRDLEKDVRGYPWPYGLTKMNLQDTQNTFAAALPQEDAGFDKGYKTFKLYCMKCHQINQVGGEMGPELNYPKSITEYMDKEDIWGFIKNPQSYRYNSKMPPMKPLSREEFEDIYKYLSHMKGRVTAS